ncbi:RHS repeat domain-containing protein [Mobilicoccus pelagius]|uniref:Rhs family protein n=1 Tax=Mobilicoccus pelagius NBRC 104925 TaxID=1089455 RepID=H5UVK6_9MICO|nr:RHS repeat domain-containing protein [Mobilicoccus pelagius]GAB49764.1 hypothetical protein MOPEL_135_00020 [Mobilicoccus pelagius NBRC 104925]
MTDGKGGKTSYTYDGDGNLIKATPPAPLGERRFECDSLGRLTASVNGRGQRVTYEYDAQDRLLSTTVPAAAGVADRTIYQSYDADGNVNFNDSVISYDAQNRQDYIKDPSGVEFSTWFDAAGNMLGVVGAGQDWIAPGSVDSGLCQHARLDRSDTAPGPRERTPSRRGRGTQAGHRTSRARLRRAVRQRRSSNPGTG